MAHVTAEAQPPVDAALPLPEVPARAATGLLRGLRARVRGSEVHSTLARGAAWSFGLNVGAMGIGFVVQLVLARVLRSEGYGTYVYVLAWTNTLMLIGKLEFDPCSVRYVGAYNGTRAWPLLRGFLARAHHVVGGASASVALIGAAIVWIIRGSLSPELARSFWIACAILPLTAGLLMQVGCLQGFKRVPQAQAPNLIVRPLLFGAGVVILADGFGVPLGASGALALQLVATAAALALSTRFLRRALPSDVVAATPEFRTREWLGTAAGMLTIAGANLVLSAQMDLLVVGTFLGTREAGVYGVANQLASLVGFGVGAVIFIATPMISDLYAQGKRAELQHMLTAATRANLALSLPAIPVLALAGRWLLGMFGADFVEGYTVLLILSGGVILAAVAGALAGFVLTMTGHQKEASVIIGGSAVLNLCLTIILTKEFGITGAAVSTAIAGAVRAGVLTWYVWRRLGFAVLPMEPLTRKAA